MRFPRVLDSCDTLPSSSRSGVVTFFVAMSARIWSRLFITTGRTVMFSLSNFRRHNGSHGRGRAELSVRAEASVPRTTPPTTADTDAASRRQMCRRDIPLTPSGRTGLRGLPTQCWSARLEIGSAIP